MCTKWHVWFNIHALTMRHPPPSPPSNVGVHMSLIWQLSLTTLILGWFWGAGKRGFITKYPNSFVQDCGRQLVSWYSSSIVVKCLLAVVFHFGKKQNKTKQNKTKNNKKQNKQTNKKQNKTKQTKKKPVVMTLITSTDV